MLMLGLPLQRRAAGISAQVRRYCHKEVQGRTNWLRAVVKYRRARAVSMRAESSAPASRPLPCKWSTSLTSCRCDLVLWTSTRGA